MLSNSQKSKKNRLRKKKPKFSLPKIELFKRKKDKKINQSSSRPRVSYYKKNRKIEKNIKSKVLKPESDTFLKAQLSNIDLRSESKKNVVLKNLNYWKNIPVGLKKTFITLKNLRSLDFKNSLISLKASIFKIATLSFVTRVLCSFLAISLLLFTIYLSYFDSYFLIDRWNINYTKNSYVDREDIQEIIRNIQQDRQLLIFPSSSYWFANDLNLTLLSKEINPDIEKVTITDRGFPNKISLDITTQDILATLVINLEGRENQYWRVSTDGRFVSQDETLLGENIIFVDKVVSFDRKNSSFKDINTFQEDKKQLDRLYFTFTVKDILESLGYKIQKVSMPSLNTADFEVSFFIEGGARLIFDSSLLDKKSTVNRIVEFSNTILYNEILEGKINYIDLRLRNNIYVCYQFLECNFE